MVGNRLAVGLLLALTFGSAACGVEAPEGAQIAARSPMEAAFQSAGAEFGVPSELLVAIGWTEARLVHRPNQATLDRGFGVMHLTDGLGGTKLARAAALTGLSREALRTDVAANIRGGAAVLGALGDTYFAEYPDLDRRQLADWWQIVMRYAEIDEPELAEGYAEEVYAAFERGISLKQSEGRLELTARPVDVSAHRIFKSQIQSALTDFPGPAANGQAIHWSASPNFNSRNGTTIDRVIIHTTEGAYAGTLSWFRNTASNVSAHYVVRSSDGDVTHMVADADRAWHIGNCNSRAIGIEHEAISAQPQWFTEAMYQSSANLTRWECDTRSIPKDRTHIIGHSEANASCGTNHSDPGRYWDWTKYMRMVTGGGTTTPTGKLTGVIYTGATTNRVATATVTLTGGPTAVSGAVDANGVYAFDVAPGTYTATAKATGYQDGSVTGKVVTSGQTTWGSIALTPAASTQTGSYLGKVYVDGPGVTASTGAAISGALAILKNSSGAEVARQTVGADGLFRFQNVAVGTFSVAASAAGYRDGTSTQSVTAGGTSWGSIGLTANTTNPDPPVITLTSPANNTTATRNPITFAGSVAWSAGTVSEVRITGGAEAIDVPLDANKHFSTDVQLREGAQTFTVTATDGTRTASVTRTVTFRSGVDITFVSRADPDTQIPGALAVLTTETGDEVARTTSGAAGVAVFDVAPGRYVLAVSATGYRSHTETLEVEEGGRTALTIPIEPGVDVAEARLFLERPAAGTTVAVSPVEVSGWLSGTLGDVVSVKVNGFESALRQDDSVGQGPDGEPSGRSALFSLEALPLVPGTNVLTIVATRADGRTLTVREQVTYQQLGASSGSGSAASKKAEDEGCGCSSVDGASLLAFGLLLAPRFGRRRRAA